MCDLDGVLYGVYSVCDRQCYSTVQLLWLLQNISLIAMVIGPAGKAEKLSRC